ncbi:sulfatase-like hydrolase/transferase [Alcanivorax sp.]|jgi:hypothetical protein|uniref:sulfatase-like hydrolase/transferase n=1 Tax=Alcanivorax sp. TaxID=1872427 RepID=UPI0032D95734
MRQFFRCVGLVFLVWLLWYGLLIQSGAALGVETINTSFLRMLENFTNWALMEDIAHFLVMQWALLVLFALLIYWVSVGLEEWLGVKGWKAIALGAAPPILLIHLINSALYPVSVMAFEVSASWVNAAIFSSFLLTVALILLACIRRKILFLQVFAVAFVFSLPYWLLIHSQLPREKASGVAQKPNVIIIGIDAVRPVELSYFGSKREVMPFLDGLLKKGRVYRNDYTPVARTHAAWVSILSGRYPYHNGARYNLMDDSYIDKKHLITRIFKNNGYRTVWGLDERRFNDIDESYGFDQAVGPKVGAADFLITKFSDLPLINVFANTRIGKMIFPFIYINRGNYVTYVPYQFNNELVSALKGGGPVFLAAHLCMPHYPFVSNMMKRVELDNQSYPDSYGRYLSMLELADRQLKDLLGKLKEGGYLENAVVYVLSDHGEGFPGVDDELQKGNPYSDFKVDAFGHGTSVLTLNQYHNLLARLTYKKGAPVGDGGDVERLSSLVDVAPDVIQSAGLQSDYSFDGFPLDVIPEKRSVIVESSYSTSAVSASRINQILVLQQSVDAYYVNDEGRLRLQPKLYNEFNKAKQRALISSDGMMVALYPDEKESAFVVDIKKNKWWPSKGFIPKEEKWKSQLSDLCDFYHDDSSFEHASLCSMYP